MRRKEFRIKDMEVPKVEVETPKIPEVKTPEVEEVKKLHEKSLISRIIRRQKPVDVPLPTKEEIKEKIDRIFSLSELSQPSKILNAGAGVADSTSLLLAANRGNVLFGAGIAISELVAWAKNRSDTKAFSDARKIELSELDSYKSAIASKLKHELSTAEGERKDEIKKLIKETKKLFSDIKKESKKGMASAFGSRVEGFAGSIGALVSLPYYKPYADMVSNYLEGFIRSQPYQPPSFNPDPIIETIHLVSWVASYVVVSGFLSYGVDWIYEKVSGRSPERRMERKQELQERAEELLNKVSKLKP